MFAYFFLVITTFWILKPLKKGIFIGHYDEIGFDLGGWHMNAAQAELLAKVLNMVVAWWPSPCSSLLAEPTASGPDAAFSAFFVVGFVIYAMALNGAGASTVWTFYLFGDLYSTLMVATFFAFLNDSVEPDSAKRLYGLIGLGGVSGGWFGTEVLRLYIEDLTTSEWMWVCLGIAIVIACCRRRWSSVDARIAVAEPVAAPEPKSEEPQGNPAGPVSSSGLRICCRSSRLSDSTRWSRRSWTSSSLRRSPITCRAMRSAFSSRTFSPSRTVSPSSCSCF